MSGMASVAMMADDDAEVSPMFPTSVSYDSFS
jgi:hypothetical protein